MLVIIASNVNMAYNDALWRMKVSGQVEQTRNGEVRAAPCPVTTCYQRPWERMLFDAKRDANPFFHVMEAMWMLGGRNDVASVARYASNMTSFSDDGVTLNGAYGHRWRAQFDTDQIDWVIGHLKNDPTSRRAVIGMWDPTSDPWTVSDGGKDVPCNTTIYFRTVGGKLTMTVCCRSNDIIWGCYGANAVHMSYLHELVALGVGLPMGAYYQVSNNWHVYPRHYELVDNPRTAIDDPYDNGMKHVPLLDVGEDPIEFSDAMCEMFDGGEGYLDYKYGEEVLQLLILAWDKYKIGENQWAQNILYDITDDAVRVACLLWLKRRAK